MSKQGENRLLKREEVTSKKKIEIYELNIIAMIEVKTNIFVILLLFFVYYEFLHLKSHSNSNDGLPLKEKFNTSFL